MPSSNYDMSSIFIEYIAGSNIKLTSIIVSMRKAPILNISTNLDTKKKYELNGSSVSLENRCQNFSLINDRFWHIADG
jgi:hypothetical protein